MRARATANDELAARREALACLAQQRLRTHLGVDDGEAGRAPGGLSHAGDAFRLEPAQGLRHRAAGEASALGGGEVVADRALDLADRAAEAGEILLHQRGHQPHQHQVREVGRALLRKRLQRPERGALGLAEQAALGTIEHQQDAPGARERHARDHRRMGAGGASAAVHDEAAFLEGADADAGARAAIEPRRQRGHRDGKLEQRAERFAHGQRELRAGAQADVLGDRLVHVQCNAGGRIVVVEQPPQVVAGALRVRPLGVEALGAAQRQHRGELLEREPEAAEAAARASR